MRIELSGAHNTRDLGGFSTADGKIIRVHRLIRSGALSEITTDDIAVLRQYELSRVVDFRNAAEQRQRPDIIMDGIEYITLPLVSDQTMGVTREKNVTEQLIRMASDDSFDAERHMQAIYADFIRGTDSARQLRRFFEILADMPQNGAILWHCTAGKDRAGVATALLLTILGVPHATILQDYLRTNDFVSNEISGAVNAVVARMGADFRNSVSAMVTTLYTVKESYLTSVFRAMEEISGSANAYLTEKLGISDAIRKHLRKLYLEP